MLIRILMRRASSAWLLLLFLLLTSTLTGTLTGCGTQAQTALKVQQALSESLRIAQVGPGDKEARAWADKAIAAAPTDPATYLGPKNPDPNSPLPQLSIAAVFGAVGDDTALADYMAQAIQKFPDDERSYQLLIQAQGRLGRTAEQRATAAKLVTLLTKKQSAPGATDIEALTTGLAQAYFDAGDPANGAAAYQKAIQAYPAEPGPPNNLAYAYAVTNTHLPEALALSQQALALAKKKGVSDEETATYQDTLGWVQYRLGDYADAEQNLLEAASADPRQAEMRYHLGMVYVAAGKPDAARTELGHAVLLSDGYVDAEQALSRLPKQTAASAASL